MQPSLLTGNICERSPPMTCSSPASEPSLLLLVIRLSVSEKSGAEWRGEEDEREGEGVWCLIESVMLDFLWSAQQESAGSHTLFLYASSSCFLFLFFSFTSYSLFFLSLKKCNLCLHVFYLFVLVRLSCSFSDRSSLPGRVFVARSSDLMLCFVLSGVLSTHACVLEYCHVCLLCEFDTRKHCHELDKSNPSSVVRWQN